MHLSLAGRDACTMSSLALRTYSADGFLFNLHLMLSNQILFFHSIDCVTILRLQSWSLLENRMLAGVKLWFDKTVASTCTYASCGNMVCSVGFSLLMRVLTRLSLVGVSSICEVD